MNPWDTAAGAVKPPKWRGPARVHILAGDDEGNPPTTGRPRGRPRKIQRAPAPWPAWGLLTPTHQPAPGTVFWPLIETKSA